jgi:hypothetical protein
MIDERIHHLHRMFMKNISTEKATLDLTKVEMSTIPNRKMYKKYSSQFKDDKTPMTINFESKQEFELCKFSHFPDVRMKFFRALTGSKENTPII